MKSGRKIYNVHVVLELVHPTEEQIFKRQTTKIFNAPKPITLIVWHSFRKVLITSIKFFSGILLQLETKYFNVYRATMFHGTTVYSCCLCE